MKSNSNKMISDIDWVGQIPESWSLIKPKYLLNKMDRQVQDGDEIITCFRDGVVTLRKNRRESGFTHSNLEIGYQRVHDGDLVVHEMDGFEGSIGVSDSFGKSTPVYTVISESKNYEVRYWMYLLREMSKTGFMESLSKSIRQRTTEFRWRMWRDLYFPVPPLSVQTQIVSFLDTKTQKIDELIEKTEQKIKLLKEKRTSLINHCVTKGLNPDVEMKDSGVEWIGEIPFHWKINSLWRLTEEIKVGLCTSVTKHYRDIGTPIIRNLNIKSGYFDGSKMLYLNEQFSEKEKSKKVKNGDVLTVHTGSNLGLSCIVPSEFDNSHTFTTLITTTQKNKLNNEYLVYLINSEYGKSEVSILKRGFGKDNLNVKEFKYFKTIEIPLSEQSQIVEYLDEQTQKIDSTIEKETQRIELLKEYRQSLISEVVTGKVDVRDWKE